jgi:cytoskeleton protein RodZ
MPIDLKKIGSVLRRAREEQGLSPEQVSDTLYLRKSVIRALESGDSAALPHSVYVRGYIAQYAKYLKVYDQVAESLDAAEKPAEAIPIPRTEAQPSPKVRDVRERPRARKAVLGGSVAIVAVVTLLLFLHGQREVPPPMQYGTENVVRNSTETQGNWTPANETKKLVIACQERTWVRIIIDGAEKKEVMLNPEEVVMFTAKEKFDLLVGNAGGVKLFFDGKDAKFEGASGEVKRVTLP